MRVANFKMVGFSDNYCTVWSESSLTSKGEISGYVRISEWVEVEFSPLPPEVTVPDEIRQLDEKIEEERASFEKKIKAVEARKAELMALTYSESAT